ncbi:MAG TPA: ABC transporter ATP-binding protein [Candidatus Sulfotelmatobacter sp.]|nr:ABC transporter ATP-binding protein [Candidatus Sulfotelmatobacter sp.]
MDSAIATNGLTKHYGSVKALDNLDLIVKKGEIFGYLGPNGSGKTTTIRAMLGLIKPTSGTCKIFGLDSEKDKVQAHKLVSYIPGEASLWPNLTGKETLYLLGKLQGQIDEKYQKVLIERFKFEPNKKVRTYSKGNRQKINIIASFMTRADLLIMDEPTTGLDPIMEQAFRLSVDEAKANHQTVFLSSHILEEVEALCDRVGILRQGKLVELGTLSEMKHLSALSVQATFDKKPPSVAHVKGVSNVKVIGHELSCQVSGPIDELLSVLAKAKPKTLISREPSLEELFLNLYGDKEIKNEEV